MTLVFHVQMQPYRNKHANLGETFLLLSLTLLVIIVETPGGHATQDYILQAILVASTLYCFLITLYLWGMFFTKLCRSHGYVEIDDMEESMDAGDQYEESFSRRLASKKVTVDTPQPSPAITRSDLLDTL